jgi:hypothetical protein
MTPVAPMVDPPLDTTPVRLIVLALARDCAPTLPVFFQWLRDLQGKGFSVTTWVGENGSQDGSRKLLDGAASGTFTVLETSFMAEAPNRLARMALGREALLEVARQQGGETDFVCVVDLDNVMASPPPPDALRAALRYFNDPTIFAIGATSDPYYYDLLSLQAPGHDYRRLQREINEAKKHPFSYYQFQRDRIFSVQRRLAITSAFRCTSSFNGLCLYRTEDFFRGSYRSEEETEICEHISLNHSIAGATGKTMLIVPDLRLSTPADHNPVGFLRFWADRVQKALRR